MLIQTMWRESSGQSLNPGSYIKSLNIKRSEWLPMRTESAQTKTMWTVGGKSDSK